MSYLSLVPLINRHWAIKRKRWYRFGCENQSPLGNVGYQGKSKAIRWTGLPLNFGPVGSSDKTPPARRQLTFLGDECWGSILIPNKLELTNGHRTCSAGQRTCSMLQPRAAIADERVARKVLWQINLRRFGPLASGNRGNLRERFQSPDRGMLPTADRRERRDRRDLLPKTDGSSRVFVAVHSTAAREEEMQVIIAGNYDSPTPSPSPSPTSSPSCPVINAKMIRAGPWKTPKQSRLVKKPSPSSGCTLHLQSTHRQTPNSPFTGTAVFCSDLHRHGNRGVFTTAFASDHALVACSMT
uniref:HDC00471 n=1 Tax=Drosophila melanogaster TaxID=7227 RepID=Q6IHX0_DROME|nr:TPA_inf: HDC00471 [Drosophila melanogaster]